MNTSLSIQRGSIFVYRVFDIAEEANLQQIESILSQRSGESRVKIAGKPRDAVIIRNAPIRLFLGEVVVPTDRPSFQNAELVATVWDYGVLSLSFQFKIAPGLLWNDLLNHSSFINSDPDFLAKLDSLANARAKEFVESIKPALKRPRVWEVFEDYIVYFFEEVSHLQNVKDLLGTGLSKLLLGEPTEALAEMTQDAVLQTVFQYSESDLVVIDWNSAVVLEPSGQREIIDVLEFALTHLLEVRYYDELLDLRLEELYDSVEAKRSQIFRNQFGAISKEANTRFLEFSEFMERMGNSLKVVGDFYLARIFRGAIRRFRIADWEESITRKTNMLARVSELLQGEANVRKGHILEVIIIFLILFEILSAMYKSL